MSIIMRRARLGDEEGIHSAHMRSINEVCAKDYTSQQIKAWGGRKFDSAAKKSLIENQYVWVVVKEGSIEGYGLLHVDEEKKKAEIGALYLTKEILGLGLGHEILVQMKLIASELQFSEILLNSTHTAKDFYLRNGAIETDKEQIITIAGESIECWPMKIKLY